MGLYRFWGILAFGSEREHKVAVDCLAVGPRLEIEFLDD